MAATLPVTMYRRPSSLNFRVKIKKGSKGGMQEDFFDALLYLVVAPVRM